MSENPLLHYCYKILAKRDYSEFKIRQKLTQRNASDSEQDDIINHLKEKNFLNEKNYARLRSLGLIRKGFSPEMIQQKLNAEFVPISLSEIYEFLDEAGDDTKNQISKLIEKKTRSIQIPVDDEPEFQKLLAKIFRYLKSKGHTASIKEIRQEILSKNPSSVDERHFI